MNQESKGWDQNLKLGKGFLVTLLLIGPGVLWFAWPLLRDAPSIFPGATIIAGCLIFPFLASVFVYVFLKVLYLVFIKREITRSQIRGLVVTLIFILAVDAIIWLVYGKAPIWTSYFTAFYAPFVYILAAGNFGKMGRKTESKKRDHHLG
jgi:hypothetical protein